VYIPKANGKLRLLGISTVRDRVCMTAAMRVLELVFEADLTPEQYAYRPGRDAQQAVDEVEERLFRGQPDVVDADFADDFSVGNVNKAYRALDNYTAVRLRRWLCANHKVRRRKGGPIHPRTSTGISGSYA
jgi:retron-type reverse transcriptase